MSSNNTKATTNTNKTNANANVKTGAEQALQSGQSTPDKERNMSDYAYVKGGWGSKMNFLLSYGEKPTPEGFHNAKVLLGNFRENHPGSKAGEWYKEESKKGDKSEAVLKED